MYLNGLMLESGVGNDYISCESGGPVSGYDTISLAVAPVPGDKIWIDFTPAI